MSYESKKGYAAEHAIVVTLSAELPMGTFYRPRTTSYQDTDVGDVYGLPLVVSVKNHRALSLAAWVDEVAAMVDRSQYDTGIVIHKRSGKGDPRNWYVSTSLGLFLPMLHTYVDRQ